MKKIDLGVIVTTLIIVTISCSLAFFTARVVGNPKDINLVAKNVSITFTDTSSIASDVISPGWNNVKTFTITNNSKEDFNYNILLKGLVNTFESINTLQYKITSDTGYNMDNYLNVIKTETLKDVVLAYDVVIPKGSKQTYQVEFKYISIDEDQSSDMGKKLGGTLAIEESTGKAKIYDKLLSDNPTIKTRTDFSAIFNETNVNTLYKAKENNTDVYYFAGDARNNWVKFAGYYWRIIRTNSDGSVRLLYVGTSPDTTEGYMGLTNYNESKNDSMLVGYMYGTSGSLKNNRSNQNSSLIKTYIDNWYETKLINYTKYLSTEAVYCNDRNVTKDTYAVSGSNFNFDVHYRLETEFTPTYSCSDSYDAFSYSNINAKLRFPIALMTADELMYLGFVFNQDSPSANNTYAWVNRNSNGDNVLNYWWWTMSPSYYNVWYKMPVVRVTYTGGTVGSSTITNTQLGAVRPVISLKGNNIWKSGDGSAEHPYIIEAVPVNTYEVNLKVNSGSGTGTVLVEEGKDAKFTVAPNSGYKAELETDTCGGTLSGNTYTISNITSAKSCSITFKSSATTLYAKLLSDRGIATTNRTTFSAAFDSTDQVLYTAKEDNKTVYYFAGNVTTNWVKFGKNENNQDLYWRIIRTNSDGGVRLLYHGTSTTATDAYIGESAFNEKYNDSMYVGYMYGTSGSQASNRTNTNNSPIKTTIDNWYISNLEAKGYTKYLSTTAVYCNDREVRNGTYSATGSTFHYAAFTRLSTNKTPTYTCTNIDDKFTVDTSTGNGKLTYPIALMTADEVSFAGGIYGNNNANANAWYFRNAKEGTLTTSSSSTDASYSSTGSTYWWLLSPSFWIGGNAGVFLVYGSSIPGFLYDCNVSYIYGVRPAISLKSCVKTSGGDGSASAPYTIEESTSGC